MAEQKDSIFCIIATGRVTPTAGSVRIFVRHFFDPLSLFIIKSHVDKTLASMVYAIFVVRTIKTVQVRADIAIFPCDVFLPIVILVLFKDVLADKQGRIFDDLNDLPRERRRRVAILALW